MKRDAFAWYTAVALLLPATGMTIGCSSDDEHGHGFRETGPGDAGETPKRDAGETPKQDAGERTDANDSPPCNCSSGCCLGDRCVSPDQMSWAACGAAGKACTTCETGALCASWIGECDNAHWADDTRLRLRMGVVKVSGQCDPNSPCDPFVCIEARGTTLCSGKCQNSNTCNYAAGSYPFVVENLLPYDFTSGTMKITVYDADGDSAEVIWSIVLHEDKPLFRKTTPYFIIPSGRLEQMEFTLEAM